MPTIKNGYFPYGSPPLSRSPAGLAFTNPGAVGRDVGVMDPLAAMDRSNPTLNAAPMGLAGAAGYLGGIAGAFNAAPPSTDPTSVGGMGSVAPAYMDTRGRGVNPLTGEPVRETPQTQSERDTPEPAPYAPSNLRVAE